MLCTRSQTFALKHVQTTNAVLLMAPAQVSAAVLPSSFPGAAASVISHAATTQIRAGCQTVAAALNLKSGQLSVVPGAYTGAVFEPRHVSLMEPRTQTVYRYCVGRRGPGGSSGGSGGEGGPPSGDSADGAPPGAPARDATSEGAVRNERCVN